MAAIRLLRGRTRRRHPPTARTHASPPSADWTLQEERLLAEFLVQNKGTAVDYTAIASVIPTRTKQSIKERVSGAHSTRLKSLILEIAEEIETSADLDQDGYSDDDWEDWDSPSDADDT